MEYFWSWWSLWLASILINQLFLTLKCSGVIFIHTKLGWILCWTVSWIIWIVNLAIESTISSFWENHALLVHRFNNFLCYKLTLSFQSWVILKWFQNWCLKVLLNWLFLLEIWRENQVWFHVGFSHNLLLVHHLVSCGALATFHTCLFHFGSERSCLPFVFLWWWWWTVDDLFELLSVTLELSGFNIWHRNSRWKVRLLSSLIKRLHLVAIRQRILFADVPLWLGSIMTWFVLQLRWSSFQWHLIDLCCSLFSFDLGFVHAWVLQLSEFFFTKAATWTCVLDFVEISKVMGLLFIYLSDLRHRCLFILLISLFDGVLSFDNYLRPFFLDFGVRLFAWLWRSITFQTQSGWHLQTCVVRGVWSLVAGNSISHVLGLNIILNGKIVVTILSSVLDFLYHL